MQVRELLKKSMLLIGAISSGENLTADEQADGLSSLNDMLEGWSTEGLLIPQYVREEFSLVGGQSEYTIGPSGDFNTVVPTVIAAANVVDLTQSPALELPLEIYNIQEYAQIPQKQTTSTIPQAIYYQYGSPLAKIFLYYVPTVANKLALYSKKPIANFTSINDQINLPVGYTRAIRYNLAVELAMEYGKQPSAQVMAMAEELKAQLMRVNAEPVLLQSDAFGIAQAGRNSYDIYQDGGR